MLRAALLYLLMLIGLLAASPTRAGPEAMTSLAERYYSLVLGRTGSGLPDAALQQQLAPLLGQRLRQALADAVVAEERYVAATPAGDKPALFEGDVLTGLYEGGQEVALADPVAARDPAGGTIAATIIRIDPRFNLGNRHRVALSVDELRFALEDGEIRLIDVRTATDRPGPGPDNLVTILEDYIRDAPR